MTEPETPESIPKSDADPGTAAAATADAEADAEPEPEPWTPEKVLEWNAYYDLYVMLGVLLLTFIVSANRISHSSIWGQLRVGREILAAGAPITTDKFSFTQADKPWVNVPWLFDLSHAFVYKVASELVPSDPQDPLATAARAEQIGAGTLVALDAIVRLLTAWLLMRIRHSGPGLWWSAVCTMVAVGAVFSPALFALGATGVLLGGIAGPGSVSPGTWGLLFLTIELGVLHRATHTGRGRAAFALVPLFLLWANFDDSFFIGLLILAAAVAGRARPAAGEQPGALSLGTGLGVLGASAAACLVNPSHVGVFAAAVDPFVRLLGPASDVATADQLSFFGQKIKEPSSWGDLWVYLFAYYWAVVLIGVASFVLNRRRFSLSRFLTFAVAAVLWAVMMRFGPEFAAVFAVTLALNGQEWFQDAFGTRGHLGAGWTFWSVGGRAVTILAAFGLVAMALTGYGKLFGDAQFGFGFDPGEFAFEAGDFLKTAKIAGQVVNTTTAQGDAILWRAYPDRRSFIDSRAHLFPTSSLNRVEELRKALSDDDIDVWKPILDEAKATAVMLDAGKSTRTYRVLSDSPNWVPFYDDGNVLLFGRADAPAADLAFFKANRTDPAEMAFRRTKATPVPDRPPMATTWMDRYFKTRALTRPQPHTEVARRLLTTVGDPASTPLPDPARCLLAVREARAALAVRPDDTEAFRLLAAAYRDLMVQEAALIAGLSLTPENAAAIRGVNPRPDQLMTRFRQRVTALNYAAQTAPPPTTEESRRLVQSIHMELFQLFMAVNFIDLARDHLQAVIDNSEPTDFTSEVRASILKDLGQLNERVKEIENQRSDAAVEQQAGPLQLAQFSIQAGAPGLALRDFEEAERTGTSPALVKPQLLDLYCDTGQPDKAVEMLGGAGASLNDPVFGNEPGTSAVRQAHAYQLLGNSEYAASVLEKHALPALRSERSARAMGEFQAMLRGEPKAATAAVLDLPQKVQLQAIWEFDAGMARLEAGTPDGAAEHFTKALTLQPDLPLRPVIAYYLERLGKPVPALPKEGEAPRADDAKKPAEAPKTETPKAEEPKKPAETPRAEEPRKPAEAPKTEEPKKKDAK